MSKLDVSLLSPVFLVRRPFSRLPFGILSPVLPSPTSCLLFLPFSRSHSVSCSPVSYLLPSPFRLPSSVFQLPNSPFTPNRNLYLPSFQQHTAMLVADFQSPYSKMSTEWVAPSASLCGLGASHSRKWGFMANSLNRSLLSAILGKSLFSSSSAPPPVSGPQSPSRGSVDASSRYVPPPVAAPPGASLPETPRTIEVKAPLHPDYLTPAPSWPRIPLSNSQLAERIPTQSRPVLTADDIPGGNRDLLRHSVSRISERKPDPASDPEPLCTSDPPPKPGI